MSNYTRPDQVSKRVRFYDGQFLQDQDFIDEQNYHLDRQARLGRSLQVAGIVEGLEVTVTGDALSITAGTAVDLQGHMLVLADSRTQFDQDGAVIVRPATEPLAIMPISGQSEQYLYLAYCQVPVDLQQGEQGLQGETRWQEAPFLFFANGLLGSDDDYDRPPWDDYVATRPTPVLLTRLQISAKGEVTVTGPRNYSGLRLAGPGAGASWTMDEDGRVQLHNGQDAPPLSIVGDNVGIGTADPGAYKLNVTGGDTLLGGNLTVNGNIQLDGPQKLSFSDADVGNSLKVQLYSGHGLGIDGSTLFYAANGRHSWRDNNGANERMALTTGADGGLTVSGTGNSSFAGNLGIGTTTPAAKLEISADTTTAAGWLEAIRFSRAEHSAITHPGGGLLFGLHSDRNFYFGDIQGGTFRKYVMTLNANNGNLTVNGAVYAGNSDMYFTKTDHGYTGTGNTWGYAAIENAADYEALMILGRAGTSKGRAVKLWDYLEVLGNLDVRGTVYLGDRLRIDAGDGQYWEIYPEKWDTPDKDLFFDFSGNPSDWVSGWLEPMGSGWRNNSDRRLKEDIEPLDGILDRVLKLRPVTYRWKDGREDTMKLYGFIAQEVQELFPDFIREKRGYMSLNYDDFAVLAVAAIQEQQRRIVQLEADLLALTSQLG